jgi:hypothetical protein
MLWQNVEIVEKYDRVRWKELEKALTAKYNVY